MTSDNGYLPIGCPKCGAAGVYIDCFLDKHCIKFCRGNGKSTLTLLAIAKKAGCLEEVLRELKNRAGGDGDADSD